MSVVAAEARHSQRLPGPQERAPIRTVKRRLAEWRPRRSPLLAAQGIEPVLISHDTHVSGQQALRLCTAVQESHINEQGRPVTDRRSSQAPPPCHAILRHWRATSLTWRSSFLFFTGSILFTLSCSLGLFQTVVSHSLCNRIFVVYPYAAGSVFYTWGAYCTMLASAAEYRRLEAPQAAVRPTQVRLKTAAAAAAAAAAGFMNKKATGKTSPAIMATQFPADPCSAGQAVLLPGAPSGHASLSAQSPNRALWGNNRYRSVQQIFPAFSRVFTKQPSAEDWATVDLAGAVIVWVGTLLYNSSCITPALLLTLPQLLPGPALGAVLHWAVNIPNIVAGCFFVSGSYIAWATAAKSTFLPHILQQRLPSGSFWAFALYLLGSIGFLMGAVFSQPLFVLPASDLIDGWFGMFVGYFLGSLCFLSGAFLGMQA